jgi:hypothetical protein
MPRRARRSSEARENQAVDWGIVAAWAVGALVVGGVSGYAIASYMAAQTPVPAGGGTALSSAHAFTPGTTYMLTATVPAGTTTAAQLTQNLAAAGWSSPTVLWFGPTDAAGGVPNIPGMPAGFNPTAGSYVAQGVWAGAANMPVPAGVTALAAPATLAATTAAATSAPAASTPAAAATGPTAAAA